jgi:hypothetical protein
MNYKVRFKIRQILEKIDTVEDGSLMKLFLERTLKLKDYIQLLTLMYNIPENISL